MNHFPFLASSLCGFSVQAEAPSLFLDFNTPGQYTANFNSLTKIPGSAGNYNAVLRRASTG